MPVFCCVLRLVRAGEHEPLPMIALVQRVARARVDVDGLTVGRIEYGMLALIGVEHDDTDVRADKLLERVLGYRMFEDAHGKMNLSLPEVGGGLLLVPQFTLAADTQKGRRPSFSSAAAPADAERLFNRLLTRARQRLPDVQQGRFGADMQVSLVNDGPVTFWLQS